MELKDAVLAARKLTKALEVAALMPEEKQGDESVMESLADQFDNLSNEMEEIKAYRPVDPDEELEVDEVECPKCRENGDLLIDDNVDNNGIEFDNDTLTVHYVCEKCEGKFDAIYQLGECVITNYEKKD